MKRWDIFLPLLTTQKGVDKKAVLEGVSRGGLIAFNWAIQNPDKVHSLDDPTKIVEFIEKHVR